MIRNLRDAVPRRATVRVFALTLGLAAFTSAGAGADPSPPGTTVTVPTTQATTQAVGIADALCLQRGDNGPEPCRPD
jgi:hypothetical protein